VKKHYIAILVTAVIILTSLMVIPFVHAANWQTVTTVTGSKDKISNNFTIQAKEWRLEWSYTPDPQFPQYSVLYVFTYPQGENISYVDYISANKTSGTEYIHQGQGNFYLDILEANIPSYTIAVQQDTDTISGPPIPTPTVPEFPLTAALIALIAAAGIALISMKKQNLWWRR
jgi:hypothetical protein